MRRFQSPQWRGKGRGKKLANVKEQISLNDAESRIGLLKMLQPLISDRVPTSLSLRCFDGEQVIAFVRGGFGIVVDEAGKAL